jgi:hypothetical protein
MILPWCAMFLVVACTGAVTGGTDDGGVGDGGATPSADARPVDPGAEYCSYIGEHDYAHPSDAFFERSEVIRIDVEMTAADWQYQLDNPDLEEYRPASVTFCGERIDGAGMRFKKSTHPAADLEEGYAKNPMVLDLNEFAPGQKLRGLRKINLEYGSDQMLVAERLNWEMLAARGLNVARVNHAQLYINGEYIGVFTNVERVDRSYAQYHWGDNDGQLYKHSYCGTFKYAGSDASGYTGDPRCYAPKPSDSVTDYADLIGVIDVIDNTADADFESAFPTVWDVDAWIPTMAALQVLGYGDTPNANGNNFYTYYPAGGGPTRLAVWDLDGGYWGDGAPCEHPADVIGWDLFRIAKCYSSLPLFDRVVAVPAWRQRYLDDARAFLDGPFDPTAFAARVDALADQLRAPLAADPNRRGDDAQWAADLDVLVERQAARAANVAAQLDAL